MTPETLNLAYAITVIIAVPALAALWCLAEYMDSPRRAYAKRRARRHR